MANTEIIEDPDIQIVIDLLWVFMLFLTKHKALVVDDIEARRLLGEFLKELPKE
jgi:hypothetical protein